MNPTPAFTAWLRRRNGRELVPVQDALRGLRCSRSTFYRRGVSTIKRGRYAYVTVASLRGLLGLKAVKS